MIDEPKVEIAKKNGLPKQWMKGLFHQNKWAGPEIPKKWTPLLWLSVALSAAVPFAAQLKNKTISLPKLAGHSATATNTPITLPDIQSSDSQKPRQETPKKQRVKVMVFTPSSVIERSSLDAIPPGAMTRAVLVTGASDGPVKAKITENLVIGGITVIEVGTVFVGRGRSTEERLDLVFRQMVLADGKVQSVRARAADKSDKIAGLKGSKVGAYASKLAAATGLNFLSGYAEGLKKRDVTNGQVVERPDPENALLNGASFAAIDLSREVLSSMKNKAPRIEVPAGTEIFILFEGGK